MCRAAYSYVYVQESSVTWNEQSDKLSAKENYSSECGHDTHTPIVPRSSDTNTTQGHLLCNNRQGTHHTCCVLFWQKTVMLPPSSVRSLTRNMYISVSMFINFIVQDFNLLLSPLFNAPDLNFHVWFQQITFKVAVLFLSLALCWIFGTKYLF